MCKSVSLTGKHVCFVAFGTDPHTTMITDLTTRDNVRNRCTVGSVTLTDTDSIECLPISFRELKSKRTIEGIKCPSSVVFVHIPSNPTTYLFTSQTEVSPLFLCPTTPSRPKPSQLLVVLLLVSKVRCQLQFVHLSKRRRE